MENARGIIWIHSAPAALRPHLEWAIGAAVSIPVRLEWSRQPAEPGSWRCELAWHGPAGTGAALASALKRCQRARFEVTEDVTGGGSRWSYTPRLGLFAGSTTGTGDLTVHEDRLKKALIADALGTQSLLDGIQKLLGCEWDAELEAFRHLETDSPVRWLHRVS